MPNWIELHDISVETDDNRVSINSDWIKLYAPSPDGKGCNVIVGDGYMDNSGKPVPAELFPVSEGYDQIKAMLSGRKL